MNDRLYRSRDDRMIAGVAGGLAEQLGLDSSLVRVAWVVLAIVTGGLLALVYLVMMLVVPEEPGAEWTGWQAAPGPGGPAGTDTGASSAGGPATGGSAFADTGPSEGGPSLGGPSLGGPGGERPTESFTPPPPPPPAGVPPASWREQRRLERATRREERRTDRAAWRAEHRDGSGAILLGILLVLVGLWFLADRYLSPADFDRLWPATAIVIGVVLVILSIRRGRATP